jgi:hypothetical protein
MRTALGVLLVVSCLLAFLGCQVVGLSPSQSDSAQNESPPREHVERQIEPLMALWGIHSKITDSKVLRITSTDEWRALWTEHMTGTVTQSGPKLVEDGFKLDFGQVMVIAVFDDHLDWAFEAESVVETDDSIIVHMYAGPQLLNGLPDGPFQEKKRVRDSLRQDCRSPDRVFHCGAPEDPMAPICTLTIATALAERRRQR